MCDVIGRRFSRSPDEHMIEQMLAALGR